MLNQTCNKALEEFLFQKRYQWFAIYTRSRHEKEVLKHIESEQIEAYLPLRTTIKQWSDRKKKVTEPLFNSYLFVKVRPKDHCKVLKTNSVVRFVSFGGKPAKIPEKQIQLINNMLASGYELAINFEQLEPGSPIKVVQGLMKGTFGELVEYRGKKRVVIKIEEIEKSVLVNIPINFLELAG
jgi:transcription antitermination factor NusG